jgi:hypothetical protein
MPVGPTIGADGTPGPSPGRFGKTGESVISQAHGKYYEATSRGNVYAAQTAATGVAPGTALGTTGAFTLSNPKGSGKRLKLMKLSMGYISGTLGAGVVQICVNNDPTAAAPTGTAITPVNMDVGSANNSVAKPLTTSTLPVAPTAVDILCSLGASLATTAVQPWLIEKDLDGDMVIEPGCSVTLEATAASGSSPLVVFNAIWEEVPIV